MDSDIQKKLQDFFSQYRAVTYKKGDTIYRPEETPDHIAYIKSGYVRQYIITQDGEERTINIFKPIFYFSLIFAMTDTQNKYYFEAITPVEMWKAPRNDVIDFIHSDPQVLFEITKNIFRGFSDLLQNLEAAISGDAYSKVSAMILMMAERFGSQVAQINQTYITISPTHKDIGGLLGFSRETVSIQMGKLQQQGIIAQENGKIYIKNLEQLRDAAATSHSS